MVCNGGVYLFTLMEWHTASWAILLLGFAEVSKLVVLVGVLVLLATHAFWIQNLGTQQQ